MTEMSTKNQILHIYWLKYWEFKKIYIYTYLLLSICGIVIIIFLPKNDWNSVIFVVLFFIEIANGRVTEKLNIFG